MTEDKRKKRKQLPKPSEHVQRLYTFAIYAASFTMPEEGRTARMARNLEGWIGLLHEAGYAAPRWLQKPYWYFLGKSKARRPEYRNGPPTWLVRALFGRLVESLPPRHQWDAAQSYLRMVAILYSERGVDAPEWLREAMEEFEVDP